ncbi:MAG: hypothetical protein WBD46_15310 [Acidobacteriaceae bacterium]
MTDPHSSSVKTHFASGHGPLLRGFTFALVLLGACVFAWGLRYKLSLYQPPHAVGHRMPAAKLLIGKERMTLPAVDLRHTANRETLPGLLSAWTLALFAIAGYGLAISAGPWSRVSSRVALLPGWARSAPSSVRPPPFLS